MNKTLRYITLVGVFIIPFLCLIVATSLFFPFITGKNFAFRIVIEITAAAWIVLALTDKAYWPRKSWIFYALSIFVVIMALADAHGAYPYKSFWSNSERMEGWITLAHLFAYFVVAATVLSKEKLWDAFFQTSFGVNLVVIMYSLLQMRNLLTINQGGVRVDATFGNAAYLAVYVLFNIFLAGFYLVKRKATLTSFKNLYFALGFNAGFLILVLPGIIKTVQDVNQLAAQQATASTGSSIILWTLLLWFITNIILYLTYWAKQDRIMYGLIIILDLIVIYNTATRGAIIGLIAGAGLAALLIAIFEKHKIMKQSAIGVVVAAVIVVGGFLAIRNTSFVQNSPVLSRFASISPTETTTLSRFKLWAMALKGFTEHPILGWGQENFNYVFNKYYNPQLYNQEQWFDRTHNVVFDWLIAGGLLGVAAYLAFFASVIFYLWKAKGEDSFSVSEKSILTGLMVAYFIHNMFVFDNLTSYILFFSVAAYVYHRTSMHHIRAHAPMINRVVLPITAIALLIMLYALNVKPILANQSVIAALSVPQSATDITPAVTAFKDALAYHTFADAEIREQIMARADTYLGTPTTQPVTGQDALITFAEQEGKTQIALTPNDARYYVFLGTFMSRAGNIPEAVTYLTKAAELSPQKQSIMFALAGTYLNEKDYVNSEVWLKKAFDADPTYEAARLGYAAAAIYTNDTKLYNQLTSSLSTTTIANSSDILQALNVTKQYKILLPLLKIWLLQNQTAQSHVYVASVYLSSGDKQNAIAEINEAIKLDPTFQTQGEQYIKEINAGTLK